MYIYQISFFSLVLGPAQDHILHLITGRGTISEYTRTGIFEVITEAIVDPITSVEEIEDSTRGANIIEVVMEITGLIGKTTAKHIALEEDVLVLGHQRGGLPLRDPEVILETLTNHHPIVQEGLHHLGHLLITAELSPPNVGR